MPSKQPYAAYFVPPEVSPDRGIALGLKWLVEQPGDRLIDGAAKRLVRFHISVRVPIAVAATGMAELDEPDAPLGKPARQ